MNLLNSLLSTLAVAGALTAQTLPRGDTKVNTFPSPNGSLYWYSWVIATPRGPALPTPANIPGAMATNQVGYVVYADRNGTTGTENCEFRRTTDGGYSWGAPLELFQDSQWSSEETVMVAEGHNVYAVFVRANGTALEVRASADQGQTWTSANVSPGLQTGALRYLSGDNQVARYENFAGGVRAVVTNGTLHIAYEVDDVATSGTNEEIYYTAVRLSGGTILTVNPEVRINTGAVGASDCDYPRIDARGQFVVVSWQEDNAQGDTSNQVFAKVSLANGADLAALPPVPVSNYATPLPTVTWSHKSQIEIPYVYHTLEDSRTGTDAVHLHRSADFGMTYTSAQANQNPIDVTEHKLIVAGSRVAIIHHSGNEIYAVVDNNSGNDILANTAVEVMVSAAGTTVGTGQDKLFAFDMRGNVLVTAYEANPGEQALLGISTDGGANWREFPVSVGFEVDEPFCALTGNFDVLYSWIDNRSCGSGNGCNDTFVSGMKVPLLTDDVANARLELDLANAGAGGPAVLIIGLGGTTPTFNNGLGFAPNLDVTLSALIEIQLVGAPGQATFFSVTPALRQSITLLGIDAWFAVGFVGPTLPSGGFLASDPVLVR